MLLCIFRCDDGSLTFLVCVHLHVCDASLERYDDSVHLHLDAPLMIYAM